MKIKATKQIIDWDAEAGQSVVINIGETGELNEVLQARHEGSWEPADEIETMTAQVMDEDGFPMDLPAGDPTAPESLALTDAERADLPQLDHDGDGNPGGSISAEGDDLPALRKEFAAKLGKRPFNGWDADELRKRIAAHDAANGDAGVAGEEAPVD